MRTVGTVCEELIGERERMRPQGSIREQAERG
jgi:hypothetical protein